MAEQNSYQSIKVAILKTNELYSYLSSFRDNYPDVISVDLVNSISDMLAQYAGNSQEIKNAHIEGIRKKKENPEICPWCGGRLVIRTARKGNNFGKQFYGCSNYPKCKYTRNINKLVR